MDAERIARVSDALKRTRFDALVCAMPANVLLLTGYWPVTGASIAIFTRDSMVALVVPEDEIEFARQSWAAEIKTFQGGSLDNLNGLGDNVFDPLRQSLMAVDLKGATSIGVERQASFDPSTYASNLYWGTELEALIGKVLPSVSLSDATQHLETLKSKLTPAELDVLRRSCDVARDGFIATARELRSGMKEHEAAGLFQAKLNRGVIDDRRCDGFAYCMSGPNAAKAYAAFQQSRGRRFEEGDLILLHCNSYTAGMWTDITRTYSLSTPSHQPMRSAVLEAGRAALDAVRPGVKALAIDHAARHVLGRLGFGKEFKHATGHAVGFTAINHNARPRIHPLSADILEPGMVFNIEPAVYVEAVGGLRHCSMVAVTDTGAELLTPFQQLEEDLVLH